MYQTEDMRASKRTLRIQNTGLLRKSARMNNNVMFRSIVFTIFAILLIHCNCTFKRVLYDYEKARENRKEEKEYERISAIDTSDPANIVILIDALSSSA